MNIRILAALSLLLAVGACGTKAVVVEDYETRKPTTICVLPVQNETVDPDGPAMLRRLLVTGVAARGYQVVDTAKIDDLLLKEFDIDPEQGGQIMAGDPVELGKAMGCDGLFYAALTDWAKHLTGYYNDVVVGGRFELLSAENGDRLWFIEHDTERKIVIPDPDHMTDWQNVAGAAAEAALASYEEIAYALIARAVTQLPPR